MLLGTHSGFELFHISLADRGNPLFDLVQQIMSSKILFIESSGQSSSSTQNGFYTIACSLHSIHVWGSN